LVVNKEEAFIFYATFIAGEYSFLKIRRDDVVLDAGASIGDFTVIASRMAKRVIVIEPNPTYLKLLERNLKLNNVNNVEILPFAIGGTEGKMKFKLNGVTSSLAEEGIEVEVKPLDSRVNEKTTR
jgi:FkbM family methyltransferase